MQLHRFDIVSFIFGVVFTGLGVTFLSTEITGLGANSEWIWPIVLLVIGAAVLASALMGVRSRATAEETGDELVELD